MPDRDKLSELIADCLRDVDEATARALTGDVIDGRVRDGVAAGRRRKTDLETAFAGLQIQFWECPLFLHSHRQRMEVTVEWRDDVAYCTWPGCENSSAKDGGVDDADTAV